jgi:hypothetical protein
MRFNAFMHLDQILLPQIIEKHKKRKKFVLLKY